MRSVRTAGPRLVRWPRFILALSIVVDISAAKADPAPNLEAGRTALDKLYATLAINLGPHASRNDLFNKVINAVVQFDIASINLAPLANEGNVTAQSLLGHALTAVPDDLKPDRTSGVNWLNQAAAQGDKDAERYLAELYLDGHYVKENAPAARRLLQQAADQDDELAEAELADLFHSGRGGAQNEREAIRLAARAAEQGSSWGLAQIGRAYANGQGVKRNPKEAFLWFTLAASRASGGAAAEFARFRDQEVGQITQAETQEAIARAHEWSIGRGGLDRVRRDAGLPIDPASASAGEGEGYGVVIAADGSILTSAHVTDACSDIKVRSWGGDLIGAEVLARDGRNDLAILKPGTSSGAPVNVAPLAPRLGQSVSILDHQAGATPSFRTGTVSALTGANDDSSGLQVTMPLQPTETGGGLWDASGSLVAIVTGKRSRLPAGGQPEPAAAYAVKATVIRLFLETKGIEYRSETVKALPGSGLAAARASEVKVTCAS